MDVMQIKQIIKSELPTIMRDDIEIQQFVLHLARTQFADKVETESKFDRVLARMERDSAKRDKQFAENEEKFRLEQEKRDRQLAETQETFRLEREERDKQFAENEEKFRLEQEKRDRQFAENEEKFRLEQEKRDRQLAETQETFRLEREERDKQFAENEEKFRLEQEERDRQYVKTQEDIKALFRKFDSAIGAIGSRWGMNSEQSYRNGLRAILEESFGVKVENINEFDEEGYVFGHPDQIELDIVIKNGLLIIIEIKSSMGRSAMYAFSRKIEFYEKKHNKKSTRRMVISPMVDKSAKRIAKKLGIEVYSYTDDIEKL